MVKRILYGLLILVVIIQFIRPSANQATGPFANDITATFPMSNEVASSLKKACYDCHSQQTTYPWYSMIQPAGWWLQHHVDEGKEHLNFHEFGTYTKKKQDHKLEEIGEAVSEGWMPLDSYSWMHSEANLTAQEKQAILKWVEESRKKIAPEAVSPDTNKKEAEHE